MRELIVNSPAYWEQFRSLPHGAQVRGASRIITNLILVFGTAGAGSTRVASVASKMEQFRLPVLSLSAEGALALRMVAEPAGQRLIAVSAGPRALYILHMANQGPGSAPSGKRGQPLTSTSAGPGKWVRKKPSSSERANRYQEQISGRPAEEVYVIDDVEYDGFNDGILLEAKGPGYRSFFQADGTPEPWYEASGKFEQLLDQARNQSRASRGLPVQWHVAEAEVAKFLQSHFSSNRIVGIQVIHTPARP